MGNVLATLVGFAAVGMGMLMLPLDPQLAQGFKATDTRRLYPSEEEKEHFLRKTVYYPAKDGSKIEAWHYVPKAAPSAAKGAAVLLGGGIGSQKDMGLESFAAAYAERGIPSLLFDYRCFGGSEGEPRNLISPSMQVEDWQSSFHYAAGVLGYSRLFLHGTSYAGGHVIVAGKGLEGETVLGGVISQIPFVGGPESARKAKETKGLSSLLRHLAMCIKDNFHALMGLDPVGFRIIADTSKPGPRGSAPVALMLVDSAQFDNFFASKPRYLLGGWKNMWAARGFFDMVAYSPIKFIEAYPKPLLMLGFTQDDLCPIEDLELAAKLAGPKCQLLKEEGVHFDLFDKLPMIIGKYVDFVVANAA